MARRQADHQFSPCQVCDHMHALPAHGGADTAPSRERHEEYQAATVTTCMQMRGPSTAYVMQPYLVKTRAFRLCKACASIRCSSHQVLVQTGCNHVPQLQRKDRIC